jgi:hypothetical protein
VDINLINEKERLAYISGDTNNAELFAYVAESIVNEEDGIDNALDLIGLYDVRGDHLYVAIENISKKLDAADKLNRRLSMIARLPKEARDAILEFRESFE